MLEKSMAECLAIFRKCPQRLKKCLIANKMTEKFSSPLLKQIVRIFKFYKYL